MLCKDCAFCRNNKEENIQICLNINSSNFCKLISELESKECINGVRYKEEDYELKLDDFGDEVEYDPMFLHIEVEDEECGYIVPINKRGKEV